MLMKPFKDTPDPPEITEDAERFDAFKEFRSDPKRCAMVDRILDEVFGPGSTQPKEF